MSNKKVFEKQKGKDICESCKKEIDCAFLDKKNNTRLCAECYFEENNINHPPHYTYSQYEVFDVLMAWFPNDPLLYQVGKYIARAKHKGKYIEDLQKARWYLDKAIERGDSET